MLKSRMTRIIAGIIGCVMTFVCTAGAARLFIKNEEFYNYMDDQQQYGNISNLNEIYRKLLIAGYMYINHLDENGDYIGSEYAEKQTISILQEMGVMNEAGELDIDGLGDFEYRVSGKEYEYFNTDKTHNDLLDEYSVVYVNGEVMCNNNLPCYYGSGMLNWFTTNYGMTYYYFDGRGYAIFDFDTKDCDSYIDELGATMYYKLDGSTPLPYGYIDMSEYMVVEDEHSYSFDDSDATYYDDAMQENGSFVEETIIRDDANEEQVFNNSAAEVTENVENTLPTISVTDDVVPVTNANSENAELTTIPFVDETQFTKEQMPEGDVTITIRPSDDIIAEVEQFLEAEKEHDEFVTRGLVELIPFAVVAVIMAVYVLIAGGYSKKEKKFVLSAPDRIFGELYIGIGILATICFVCAIDGIDGIKEFFDTYYSSDVFYISCGVGAALYFGLMLLIFNSLVIRLKCRSFIKTTLTYRIVMWFGRQAKKLWKCGEQARKEFREKMVSRDMLRNDKFTRRFILRTAAAVVLSILAILLTIASTIDELILICGIIILAGYIYFSLADFKAIQRLNEHISAVNSGDYTARVEALDSPIYVPTEKLNNISTGIQGTVEKQVRSERMKIELVTNVSHDLKTPLTSIISYIDLLSAEELPPAARDYVTIIEGKSQRLKTMVADLFDLAKATSRTDVQSEEIDAVVLTRQVLGDLADKIETSGRTLKSDIQAESAPINADGKKMYRVFQNVIDNALKYSMEGTRVYLTLKRENGVCSITVKNIASYEMTFSPDEITERFTRGDESRSTEGNGLGLSIAKSFTEACGGTFRVDIDGDVFAAVIEMPCM